MRPLSPIGSPLPLRLLNKGPDYLRRQMEAGPRGRSVSAVERLEADKAKYVKSQQVIDVKQEPALNPCASPATPRRPPSASPATPRRPTSASPAPPRRPPSASPATPRRPPATPRGLDDSRKENVRGGGDPGSRRGNHPTAPHSAPTMRRSTGKRALRPDSLLIYRQKKECKSPAEEAEAGAGGEMGGYGFVRRLFRGSSRGGGSGGDAKPAIIEEKASSRDGDSHMSWSLDGTRGSGGGNPAPPDPGMGHAHADPWESDLRRSELNLRRSESDLRLRSSLALSEHERFFDFCGLDRELLDRLGTENFPSGGSVADTLSLVLGGACGVEGGSEPSEFSRHSGEGPLREGPAGQGPVGVSIVERNARVIKWLYGCKNATRGADKGPKESTV